VATGKWKVEVAKVTTRSLLPRPLPLNSHEITQINVRAPWKLLVLQKPHKSRQRFLLLFQEMQLKFRDQNTMKARDNWHLPAAH